MFSKNKSPSPAKTDNTPSAPLSPAPTATADFNKPQQTSVPKVKPPVSVLSADLHIKGNVKTTGDIQIEGRIDGDVRAHLLTIGESATVKGEVVADDTVIHGHIVGRVRGLKVRLTSSARVEGDIVHKTIAIESGAHFEGSVQRQDDPIASKPVAKTQPPIPQKPAPTKPQS